VRKTSGHLHGDLVNKQLGEASVEPVFAKSGTEEKQNEEVDRIPLYGESAMFSVTQTGTATNDWAFLFLIEKR